MGRIFQEGLRKNLGLTGPEPKGESFQTFKRIAEDPPVMGAGGAINFKGVQNFIGRLFRAGKIGKQGRKLLQTEFQKADPKNRLSVPLRAQQNIRESDPLTGIPMQRTPSDRRFSTGGRFQSERDEFLGSGKDIIPSAQAVGGFPKSETGTESMQKGADTLDQILRRKPTREISGADVLSSIRGISENKSDALERVGSMRRLLEIMLESQEDLRFQGTSNKAKLVEYTRFSKQLVNVEKIVQDAPKNFFEKRASGTSIAEIRGGMESVFLSLGRLNKIPGQEFKVTEIESVEDDPTSGFALRSEEVRVEFLDRRIQGKNFIEVNILDGRGEDIDRFKLGEFEVQDEALQAFESYIRRGTK